MGIFSAIRAFVIALPYFTWKWAINNTDKSNKCNWDPHLGARLLFPNMQICFLCVPFNILHLSILQGTEGSQKI